MPTGTFLGKPLDYPDHHGPIINYDSIQKGMGVKCQCGWEFNGVFSSPEAAKTEWWRHARQFDGDLVAQQLREREAVFAKSREIIEEFTKKK